MYPPHSDDPHMNDGPANPPHPESGQNGDTNGGYLVPAGRANLPSAPMIWPEMTDTRPEILTARPDPLTLARSLRRHWLLAAILAFCSGSTAFVLAYLLIPLNYEVDALIEVKRSEESAHISNRGAKDPKAIDAFIQSQPYLVTSPMVLMAALRDPDVSQLSMLKNEPDKARWLKDNLIVGYLGDSEIMRIMMRDAHPQEMVSIVNAVKDAYLVEVASSGRDEKRRQLETLRNEFKSLEDKIKKNEEIYNRLKVELGSLVDEEANARERILLSQLLTLEGNLNRAKEQERDVKMRLISLQMAKAIAQDPRQQKMALDAILMEDPQIRDLAAQVRTLQQYLAEQQGIARRDTPAIQGIRNDISRAQKRLEDAKAALMPVLQEQYQFQNLMQIETEFKLAAVEAAALKKQIEELEQQIIEKNRELKTVRQYDSELATVARNLDGDRKTFEELKQQISGLEVDLNLGRRISKISDATMPDGISRRFWLVLVGFCGLCGAAVAVVGFGYHQFAQRRVESIDQVNRGLGLTVMGSLPDLSTANGKASKNERLHGVLAESIDGIRTMLLYGDRSKSNQIVMVTSASEQEGKSTVASQLAASLARAGKRTLLMDGDLRNPAVHAIFDLPLGAGFSELVRGDAELDEVIQNSPAENLWVVSAGHCTAQSIQCLAHESVDDVFARLRTRFDFIIVDSGPVLAFADSLLMGQFVDSAILSVRRDRSHMTKVYDAFERMTSVNIRVLGTVVNGEAIRPTRRKLQPQLAVAPV